MLLKTSLKNDFSRFQALQQFVDIFIIAFTGKQFARGNIQQSNTRFIINKMDSCQKIIAVMLKEFVTCCNTRSYHFGNSPLNNSLYLFRIFKLITNSNTVTS